MRPSLIRIGSLASILGAIIALVVLALNASEGDSDIATMLWVLVVAVLFFATAGNFHEGGISKSQPMALVLVAINVAVIIAAFAICNAFIVPQMLILIICAIVAGAAAVFEAKWYDMPTVR